MLFNRRVSLFSQKEKHNSTKIQFIRVLNLKQNSINLQHLK